MQSRELRQEVIRFIGALRDNSGHAKQQAEEESHCAILLEILPIPLDGTSKTILETDFGLISEPFFSARDIGLRMLDVAFARITVNRRDVLFRDFVDLLKHGVQGNAVTARNVENFPGDPGGFAGQKIRLDNILYKREVPRLKAVAVNGRAAILENCRNEQCQHAAVLRCRVLPGTEHIEIAQGYSLEAIRASEHLA